MKFLLAYISPYLYCNFMHYIWGGGTICTSHLYQYITVICLIHAACSCMCNACHERMENQNKFRNDPQSSRRSNGVSAGEPSPWLSHLWPRWGVWSSRSKHGFWQWQKSLWRHKVLWKEVKFGRKLTCVHILLFIYTTYTTVYFIFIH